MKNFITEFACFYIKNRLFMVKLKQKMLFSIERLFGKGETLWQESAVMNVITSIRESVLMSASPTSEIIKPPLK